MRLRPSSPKENTMLDGRFDQQFAEIFALKSFDLAPPKASRNHGIWSMTFVALVFVLALIGLTLP
jgi:hypothetical protein